MDLQTLEQECLVCRRCGLCESRTHVVFGQGAPSAEVLLVGEGPGANEDEQGLPFVGRSGQLLDHYLEAVDLDRNKNVYIANIVKCRPPQNRDPLPEETSACLPWLRQQFQLLRPKIIVCLGRIAAQQLIDPGFSVSRDHGKFFDKHGTLFMATYHPAALLRYPANKPAVFGDFVALREKSGRFANTPIEDHKGVDHHVTGFSGTDTAHPAAGGIFIAQRQSGQRLYRL